MFIKKYMEEDGDIFELINEECYYDDKWLEEKRIKEEKDGKSKPNCN